MKKINFMALLRAFQLAVLFVSGFAVVMAVIASLLKLVSDNFGDVGVITVTVLGFIAMLTRQAYPEAKKQVKAEKKVKDK